MRLIFCVIGIGLFVHSLMGQRLVSPEGTLVAVSERHGDFGFSLCYRGRVDVCVHMGIQGSFGNAVLLPGKELGNGPGNECFREYRMETSDGTIAVRLRLFDHAFAFRYEGKFPDSCRIFGETSSWKLPDDTKVWYFERNNAYKLKSYAGEWRCADILRMPTVSAQGPVQGTPLVFQFAGGEYGFLSEAGLDGYSGMRLRAEVDSRFSVDFTEGDRGFSVAPEWASAWRVLYFAESLNELVNQRVIRELSLPLRDTVLYADCSYVRPGKSVWRWFTRLTGNFDEEKKIVEQAALLGLDYTTVDEGWEKWPEKWKTMSRLVEYAESRGVGVFVWKRSEELADEKDDFGKMRHWLDTLARTGVAGIKVDFMNSESCRTIRFDNRLLREAALRRLMVNFHGCQAPAGEQYAWPNEITREGIRGLELNKMNEGMITARHNAALPFTRFILGNGDYTPLSFTAPGETTWAHQLATLVCFTSALQTIAEDPGVLLSEPLLAPALDFIRKVPVVWDETRVLEPSRIGELAILARRKGDVWYVGMLNGTDSVQRISFLPDFMPNVRTVRLFSDDMAADRVVLKISGHRPGRIVQKPSLPFVSEERKVIPGEPLSVVLAPAGGAVFVME